MVRILLVDFSTLGFWPLHAGYKNPIHIRDASLSNKSGLCFTYIWLNAIKTFISFIRRFLKVLKQYFAKFFLFFLRQFWFKSFLVRLSLKMLDPFWLTLIDFSGCCITVSDNINFVQSWRLSLNNTFRFKFETNVTSFGLRFAHMSFPATFVSFPASWWAGSETRT